MLIAAGGCGREVLQWAKDINKENMQENGIPKWNIKGFIDDNCSALDNVKCEVSILNTIDHYTICKDDQFVCCIGNGNVRQLVVEKLKSKGAIFANLIHPTAIISDTVKMGEGVIVYPFALLSDNAKIGDGCIINMHSSVAHDSVLGNFCTISAHCDITGMCMLGNKVFMGTTSNMVPGTKIGDDVYICAGSTVMAKVQRGRKVLGNPAKIVKL